MPPIGARTVRRSSARRGVADLELGGARRQPRLAQRHVGGGAARLQLLDPLERRLGLGDVELGAGEGDHLGLVVETRDDVARGHDRAPEATSSEVSRPETSGVTDTK